MLIRRTIRRRRATLNRKRAEARLRKHVAEQLEVRAAPGSMLVDALALMGHPLATAHQAQTLAALLTAKVARETQATEARRGSAATGQDEQIQRTNQLKRAFDQIQPAERSNLKSARTEAETVRRPGKGLAQRERPSTEQTQLIANPLEMTFDELLVGSWKQQLRTGHVRLARGLGAGSPSGQSPTPTLTLDNLAASTGNTNPTRQAPEGSMPEVVGGSVVSGGYGSPRSASSVSSTAESAPDPSGDNSAGSPHHAPGMSPTLTEPASTSDSTGGISSSDESSGHPSSTRGTLSVSFRDGLSGWTVHEMGGSPEGRGNVTEGSAVLHEGDSFLVTIDRQLTIPESVQTLEFAYEAFFDTTDPNAINDAFEVALVDSDGFSLVDTFRPDRDAYFNLTESLPVAMADGVGESPAPPRHPGVFGHNGRPGGNRRDSDISPREQRRR